MARPYIASAGRVKCVRSEPRHAAMQVVGIRALDFRGDDFTHAQRAPARDIDRSVDVGRVGFGAALRDGRTDLVDDDLLPRADLALQTLRENRLLARHQRLPALRLDSFRHAMPDGVGRGAGYRFIFEGANASDPGFLELVEQISETGLGLAGKADDEGGTQGEFGAPLAPLPDPRQRLVLRRRTLHLPEDFRTGVLKRNVEIGQDPALRHQGDDLVDMRVGVDILQPDPGAEFAEFAGEIEKSGADLAVLPRTRGVFQVDAVGRGEIRSEEHTSELQSPDHLVCRLLLEKKNLNKYTPPNT